MSGTAPQTTCDIRRRVDELICVAAERAAELEGRRATHRYPLNMRVDLGVMLAGGDRFTRMHSAWGVDLSAYGVGLIAEQEVPTQLRMVANFSDLAGKDCFVPLRILYCRRMLTATYQVGGVFLHMAE